MPPRNAYYSPPPTLSASMEQLLAIFSEPALRTETVVMRLVCSMLLGLLIGFEREAQHQPAGMRTHMLICVGSTIFTMLSIYLPWSLGSMQVSGDAARIAAQIVSGIGFLGAGAIIKFGVNVRGITTAATIWATAAVGMAAGCGMLLVALVGTLIILLVLVVFELLEVRIFANEYLKIIEVDYLPQGNDIAALRGVLVSYGIRVRTVDIHTTNSVKPWLLRFSVRIPERVGLEALVAQLNAHEGVQAVRVMQAVS